MFGVWWVVNKSPRTTTHRKLKMNVGIIGAGFTGLSAGYRLAKSGVEVTIFENDKKPGGLAVGFEEARWDWTLEQHYHHWFTSDWAVRNLAKEIGHKIYFKRPITSVYIENEIFQLDSVKSLLSFNRLALMDRLRTGVVLAYLKYISPWKPLERYTSEKFLKVTMGSRSWKVLWEPLFKGKFGKYSSRIPASWFWARIKKRSAKLGYPERGFLSFAKRIDESIHRYRGKTVYGASVEEVSKKANKIIIKIGGKKYKFNKVICTLPTPVYLNITKGLPQSYKDRLKLMKGLGAVTLVLSLNKKFFKDNTYWLNINEKGFPFLALVEHTNLIDKKYYNNEHILYIGNYLHSGHRYFQKDARGLLQEFMPFLQKINNGFSESQINKSYLFKTPFAQPIIPLNYSKVLPKMETPLQSLYLANMQMVYPWDRGTNYAVELGEKAADLVLKSQ